MSKIVTFEQAKKLRSLGFRNYVLHYYDRYQSINSCSFFDDECRVTVEDIEEDCNASVSNYSAPSVHEALDWTREEKGVDCCVFFNNELFGNLDNAKAIYYFKYGCNGRIIYNSWNVDYKSFDTHPLAESSLLDAVLDYLEKK